MTLAQLETLLAVVETGSFTAAGARLGLTQSGVSHAIAALEVELGVQLLVRERGRDRGEVTLTEVGLRVLQEARMALLHVERARQEAAATLGLKTGTLRIGSFPSAASRLLPRLISDFTRRYPTVHVELREGTDQEVVEWLRRREVELGVVTLPTEGLESVPLAEDEMLLLVSERLPLAQQEHVSLADLAHEPFVMSQGGCEPLIRAAFHSAGLAPQVRFALRDLTTLLAFVREGMGVTLVPELALPSTREGLSVKPLSPTLRRRIALGATALTQLTPAARAFLALATNAPDAKITSPTVMRPE